MNPSVIIGKKRDGERLTREEINWFVDGYLRGEVADYQMSALLMAIFFNGLDAEETAFLTESYIYSGLKIDWSDLPGLPVDKHSTGGVGDKVSIVLAPLVASCGGFVPMISGRGLGHTGGTLDKLESIPGFRTNLSIESIKEQVSKIGCAMGAQTAEIAPADGKIYALRDVTATVESIPLISASIMSKKIAEGAKGLVLDIKVGNGAFMETIEKAKELARLLIAIGEYHGQKVRAIFSDMSEPLGNAVGNALEIEECILLMRGDKDFPKLHELTIALAGEMLVLSGIAENIIEAEKLANEKLNDGSALEKFSQMVSYQNGNPEICNDTGLLPKAKIILDIPSIESGFISSIDTKAIGMAGVELGAGRRRSSDSIDPSVGFEIFAKIGDKVSRGDLLGVVHSNDKDKAKKAIESIQKAYSFSENRITPPKKIIDRM